MLFDLLNIAMPCNGRIDLNFNLIKCSKNKRNTCNSCILKSQNIINYIICSEFNIENKQEVFSSKYKLYYIYIYNIIYILRKKYIPYPLIKKILDYIYIPKTIIFSIFKSIYSDYNLCLGEIIYFSNINAIIIKKCHTLTGKNKCCKKCLKNNYKIIKSQLHLYFLKQENIQKIQFTFTYTDNYIHNINDIISILSNVNNIFTSNNISHIILQWIKLLKTTKHHITYIDTYFRYDEHLWNHILSKKTKPTFTNRIQS